jgi:crotonobetainyl-CoA:carnitine CoA-transferase CaiB-like acyl-CoA transferase
MESDPAPRLPLEGVRVVDLTQVMAGPFCTMLLADLGADVIKVEPPDGDLSRSMGGERLRMKGRDNAPFLALNRNKRSVVLDLKQPADLQKLLLLAQSADVFVENFRPGVADRLGVGFAALSQRNPRLVYASISGFGQTGPWADRPGFDLIAQGMSGVMSVTGTAGGEPVKSGVPVSDLSAGLYAANGIQAALLARVRTGRGQRVETSLFEAALGLSVWEATEYWATHEPPAPLGSAHRLSAPYQAFRASDGWLTIAALTTQQWERLCAVVGRTELIDDSRFRTNADRVAHRSVLAAELGKNLGSGTVDEWVERFLAEGIPSGPILDYAEVFAGRHTDARQMVITIDHPVEGPVRTLGVPVKLSDGSAAARRPPPLLGEHTAAVLEAIASDGSPWESTA